MPPSLNLNTFSVLILIVNTNGDDIWGQSGSSLQWLGAPPVRNIFCHRGLPSNAYDSTLPIDIVILLCYFEVAYFLYGGKSALLIVL